jgi:hypothetical protein
VGKTTFEQALMAQIEQFRVNLTEYRKAQANSPSWLDTESVATARGQFETVIRELEAKIDTFEEESKQLLQEDALLIGCDRVTTATIFQASQGY